MSLSKCKNCGGDLLVNNDGTLFICQHCGASEYIPESDEVKIEKIKSKTYSEVEMGKQKLESEKLKFKRETEVRNEEKAKKQEETENINNFKKSKFSKVIIAFAIISILMCWISFSSLKIVSGIIAIIQTLVFVVAWLMGLGVIKEKVRNLHLVLAVLGFVLIIPFISTGDINFDSNSASKSQAVIWSDMELGNILPEPLNDKGKIMSNTDACLSVYIAKYSEKDYKNYLSACKDEGFTIDSESNADSYIAYNGNGYKLNLQYDEYDKEIHISLDKPIEMSKIKWPKNGLAKKLPVPESDFGKIEYDSSTSFIVRIGKVSKNQYDQYIEKCMNEGFDIDYRKYDDSYYAEKRGGYELIVKYEGNQTMYIRIISED